MLADSTVTSTYILVREQEEMTNVIANVSDSELEVLKKNIDDFFILINGIIVCLMQCGFACLEAGAVRSKNATNIVMKNFMDVFISALCYWLVGYTLAYGEGSQILGYRKYWAGVGLKDHMMAHWFFQFVFAATAATLISGAVAERCHFVAYILYSAVVSGVIYPVASHWVWADLGWLKRMGYRDFSGCGPVHLLAGTCSFVAASMMGPRIGRFSSKMQDSDQHIYGHSVPLTGLGGMILVTGFLAFNGGTLGSVTNPGDSALVSCLIVNTVLGGTGGSIAVLASSRLGLCDTGGSYWSFLHTLNGAFVGMQEVTNIHSDAAWGVSRHGNTLIGMLVFCTSAEFLLAPGVVDLQTVSVCAGVNEMSMWASFVSGAIAGPIYLIIHYTMQWCKVDDPLDTVAIHFGGGLWGLLSASIFSHSGLVYGFGHTAFMLMAYRIAGATILIAWSIVTSCLLFGTMKYFGILRVSADQETQGLDISLHNEPGYPEKA